MSEDGINERQLLKKQTSNWVVDVDLHPSEPWVAVAEEKGPISIWNYESGQLVKTINIDRISEYGSILCLKFVPRKNWLLVGTSEGHIRVFNYVSGEQVLNFKAHTSWLHSISVHPKHQQPSTLVFTCSDDKTIKLWDWANGTDWLLKQTFEGHSSVVKKLALDPTDKYSFATASKDRTVKVWMVGTGTPIHSFAHDDPVAAVDYYHHKNGSLFLVSGTENGKFLIWNCQYGDCVTRLHEHSKGISDICSLPDLNIIVSSSYDKTVLLWKSVNNSPSEFQMEKTLDYELGEVNCIAALNQKHVIAMGFDRGAVVVSLNTQQPQPIQEAREVQPVVDERSGHRPMVPAFQRKPIVIGCGFCRQKVRTVVHTEESIFNYAAYFAYLWFAYLVLLDVVFPLLITSETGAMFAHHNMYTYLAAAVTLMLLHIKVEPLLKNAYHHCPSCHVQLGSFRPASWDALIRVEGRARADLDHRSTLNIDHRSRVDLNANANAYARADLNANANTRLGVGVAVRPIEGTLNVNVDTIRPIEVRTPDLAQLGQTQHEVEHTVWPLNWIKTGVTTFGKMLGF